MPARLLANRTRNPLHHMDMARRAWSTPSASPARSSPPACLEPGSGHAPVRPGGSEQDHRPARHHARRRHADRGRGAGPGMMARRYCGCLAAERGEPPPWIPSARGAFPTIGQAMVNQGDSAAAERIQPDRQGAAPVAVMMSKSPGAWRPNRPGKAHRRAALAKSPVACAGVKACSRRDPSKIEI
jgi:hypothetical protein